MWCFTLGVIHGLLLLLCMCGRNNSLTSSSTGDCKCPTDAIQNSKCSKQTNCTVVCNEGYRGDKCEFGRRRYYKY